MVHVAKIQDSADAKLRPQEGKELARVTGEIHNRLAARTSRVSPAQGPGAKLPVCVNLGPATHQQ